MSKAQKMRRQEQFDARQANKKTYNQSKQDDGTFQPAIILRRFKMSDWDSPVR